MGRAGLAAKRVAVTLAILLAAPACGATDAPAGPAPTQALCDAQIPTYPVKPKRSQDQRRLVYDQTLSPIVPPNVASGGLCRYRDGNLTQSVALDAGDLAKLPGLLDNLPADQPRTCAEPTPGLAEDVIVLIAPDRRVTRTFVPHGGCRNVRVEGQVRKTSKALLSWLDLKLGSKGDTIAP